MNNETYAEMLPVIKDYLDSCTNIMADGYAKGSCHEALVKIHVKNHGGCEDTIRTSTRALTDDLEATIGLDLEEIPCYLVLCPLFFHKWCEITGLIQETETTESRMITQVETKRLSYSVGILNSYGYKPYEHSDKKDNMFILFQNRSGDRLKVKQNAYFSCTVQMIKGDSNAS